MNTPFEFLLNAKTSKQLKLLRTDWQLKVSVAQGADKKDAQKYLDAINAELRQRTAQSTLTSILTAPAEMVGVSLFTAGGAGGAVGGAMDSVGSAASSVGSGLKSIALYVGGAAFILAAAYIYLSTKKK